MGLVCSAQTRVLVQEAIWGFFRAISEQLALSVRDPVGCLGGVFMAEGNFTGIPLWGVQ